jgi:hypothetical protein
MTLRYIIGDVAPLRLMAWAFPLMKERLFFDAIWWVFATGGCGATVAGILLPAKVDTLLPL